VAQFSQTDHGSWYENKWTITWECTQDHEHLINDLVNFMAIYSHATFVVQNL